MTDELEHFLPIGEVKRITGNKSTRTIYRWVEQGLFPRPVALGPNSIGWPQSAIKEWVEARKANDIEARVKNRGQVGTADRSEGNACNDSRALTFSVPSEEQMV